MFIQPLISHFFIYLCGPFQSKTFFPKCIYIFLGIYLFFAVSFRRCIPSLNFIVQFQTHTRPYTSLNYHITDKKLIKIKLKYQLK